MRLLLIESSGFERTPLARQLRAAGLPLDHVCGSSEAQGHLAATRYDLALVDLSLADRRAQALLEERQAGAHIPMIALVPKDSLARSGPGLALCADDWVSKPVVLPELTARIRAILGAGGAAKTYRAGALIVRPDAGHACYEGSALDLSKRELAALTILVRCAPYTVPRPTLEAATYGAGTDVTPNAIEAVLSRLRRALKRADSPVRIVALRGIGWRLTIPEQEGDPMR
ncbi:MAG: response regulator transcription factor [Pseudomonadota bacterium]